MAPLCVQCVLPSGAALSQRKVQYTCLKCVILICQIFQMNKLSRQREYELYKDLMSLRATIAAGKRANECLDDARSSARWAHDYPWMAHNSYHFQDTPIQEARYWKGTDIRQYTISKGADIYKTTLESSSWP